MSVFRTGDQYQLRFYAQLGQQTAITTVNFRVVSIVNGSPTDLDAAAHYDVAANLAYRSFMTTQATYLACSCQANLVSGGQQQAVFSQGNPSPGQQGSFALPSQVSFLLSVRGGKAGRHGRGRMYLPFPGTDGLVGMDVPSNAQKDGVKLFSDSIVTPTDIILPSGRMTVQGIILPRSKTLAPVDIVQTMVNSRYATQRRRGAFGKQNLPPFPITPI